MTPKAVILTIPQSSYEVPDQLWPCEFEQLFTELHTKHFQKTPKIAFLHKDCHIPRGTGMLKMRGLMVVWGEHVGAQMSLSLFAPPFLSHLVTSWDLLWMLRGISRHIQAIWESWEWLGEVGEVEDEVAALSASHPGMSDTSSDNLIGSLEDTWSTWR
ncbi:hypothetical protein BXZ70DRAFT_1079912 [Cristinia sonorae]|uniref:Uncharacterized protein n=1 Tax=Cristinia sonorae TaxID=1940300 RepID=A0A8K0UHC4_9AGAR|nr:hypothetical protein BXZ70DRAFT_1079912 [Cristinia sonorae]